MRVRMTTGKFLFQEEIVFLTPHLEKKNGYVTLIVEYQSSMQK